MEKRASFSAAALDGDSPEALAWRIEQLEQRLAQRTRISIEAMHALSSEIGRREKIQASLLKLQELESLGFLASGVAHDLANVLGIVSVGFGILERRSHEAEVLDVVKNGLRAVDHGKSLIANLMDFVGNRAGPPVQVDSAAWLAEMEILLGYAAGPHAACRLQAARDAWPVRVEDHRLSSVLINLVLNARDAMPQGGDIGVAVRNLPAGAVRPAQAPAGDLVVFSVTDTGCGMTPEVLAQATMPLFSTKAPGKGTGLGLHMALSFARACAGCLHIESQPGAGTRVSLYLPRSDSAAQQAPDPEHGSVAGVPRNAVLLVDEDDGTRAAIAARLQAQDLHVVEVRSAEMALSLLPTAEHLVLAVVSLTLPGMGGPALVLRLRQERPGLPALLLASEPPADSPLPGVPLLHKAAGPGLLETLVQAQIASPASQRDKADAMLDRLMLRLRSPELLAPLLAWREARGSAVVPAVEAIGSIAPGLADSVFVAALQGSADNPTFHFEAIGPALLAQLGPGCLSNPIAAAHEHILGTLAGAYRRAARTGLPSYEYARFALDDGGPVGFERLILPVSSDGRQVSHLLGIALFDNLAVPATGSHTS